MKNPLERGYAILDEIKCRREHRKLITRFVNLTTKVHLGHAIGIQVDFYDPGPCVVLTSHCKDCDEIVGIIGMAWEQAALLMPTMKMMKKNWERQVKDR